MGQSLSAIYGRNLHSSVEDGKVHFNMWYHLSSKRAAEEIKKAAQSFGINPITEDFRNFLFDRANQDSNQYDEWLNKAINSLKNGGSIPDANFVWKDKMLEIAPYLIVSATFSMVMNLAPGVPGSKLLGAMIAKGWNVGKNAAGKLVFLSAGKEVGAKEIADVIFTATGTQIALKVINEAMCFAPDTLVLTRNGMKPICTVAPGDYVKSFDFTLNTWSWAEVSQLLERRYFGQMIAVGLDDSRIVATGNHPFWVVDGNKLNERRASIHTGI